LNVIERDPKKRGVVTTTERRTGKLKEAQKNEGGKRTGNDLMGESKTVSLYDSGAAFLWG